MLPTLSRITVYPIKSLEGHDLLTSAVLEGGALAGDRRYALVDSRGRYINGKRCEAMHRIRASFSDDLQEVVLRSEGQERNFAIAREQEALAAWCSEVLGRECRLVENVAAGFPDDVDSPGPTLVSSGSLEAVADWFEGLDVAEVRRRFRFNLEVADTEAFWEDGLVGSEGEEERRFRLGDLTWQGCGVCQRCVVPTRGSRDGLATSGFVRDFARFRERDLPAWVSLDRFDHFYRLGVNTKLDSGENNKVLQLGDTIEVMG